MMYDGSTYGKASARSYMAPAACASSMSVRSGKAEYTRQRVCVGSGSEIYQVQPVVRVQPQIRHQQMDFLLKDAPLGAPENS